MLSLATSIKILEARLEVLSPQMHRQKRDNDHICMAITTESGKPIESSMGSNTPLLGGIKESVCGTDDGDRLTGAEIEMIKKEAPLKSYT